MAATEFGDRTAIVRLKQQLSEAVERAYALAWAVVRLEGKAEGAEAERAARDALLGALASPAYEIESNVVSFSRADLRGPEPARALEGGASAQEMLLAILKENEASVRELQTALEDYGLSITPGNLSVILSRMNQAGLIQRTGRGMYKYAR
jgi:DNA-binding transcriptional ArsR family regulator